MLIKIASVFVDDQHKAIEFHTEKLGFEKNADIPCGDFRWLTAVSAEAPNGTQLLLEPNAHPAAAAYQQAIRAEGIPATSLFVEDIQTEVETLKRQGVRFTVEPTDAGGVAVAVLDDTCGNLIQLVEQ